MDSENQFGTVGTPTPASDPSPSPSPQRPPPPVSSSACHPPCPPRRGGGGPRVVEVDDEQVDEVDPSDVHAISRGVNKGSTHASSAVAPSTLVFSGVMLNPCSTDCIPRLIIISLPIPSVRVVVPTSIIPDDNSDAMLIPFPTGVCLARTTSSTQLTPPSGFAPSSPSSISGSALDSPSTWSGCCYSRRGQYAPNLHCLQGITVISDVYTVPCAAISSSPAQSLTDHPHETPLSSSYWQTYKQGHIINREGNKPPG
ncbi:hypothetical protein Cgig2_025777 [Carnegiea gigantea]|uniref:Uncharacterized protein n=1 Tax=Carnegiea gigantea TaxID=171969 RepID=A0A9Q1GSW8_9CARY|nr:hypothetical protein Cgig2_025777 [Carnegiea gigantea]